MRPWDGVALWRTLAFAAAALALLAVGAALLLTVPVGARGPAPRPTLAVLVDDARQAVWLALANPAGTRLELHALRPLAPPPGRVFALWLIEAPGAAPRSLGVLAPAGRALEDLPVLLHPGAVLGVSLEPAPGAAAPSGPLAAVGALISTDGLQALPIAASAPLSGSP